MAPRRRPRSEITLAVIALGILLAAATREPLEASGRATSHVVALYAVCASVSFGISIYSTGRASRELPVGWAVAPPRLAGLLVVVLPLAATSNLRLTRPALPFVLGTGVAEVVGFASYALGARHGIAVAAVLASQFAAIAAIGAYFLFRERLTRVQLAGVALIIAGVAVLIALQA
jgi:drug/metabolite transporter (DMT)-like permease